MTSHRVLVVTSSANALQLAGGKVVETGYFLPELYIPIKKLSKHGYTPVFANPHGNTPTMDPRSDSMIWFGMPAEYKQAKEWISGQHNDATTGSLGPPVPFSSITEEDLNSFDGLFVPGGHAPLVDLHSDADLGAILRHFHRHGKPTGMICHGPIAMLSARSTGQSWPYTGYQMTAYSNREEFINEQLWRDKVPLKVQDALIEAGGDYQARWPLMPNVIRDRELITGQGPTSSWRFGKALVRALDRYGLSRSSSGSVY